MRLDYDCNATLQEKGRPTRPRGLERLREPSLEEFAQLGRSPELRDRVKFFECGGKRIRKTPDAELDAARPCPVCLIDRTRVLFRFSESQQASLHLSTEVEAVFRMLKRPKRDVFEFSDGRQITLGDLPAGLIFDVLVVPGSEQLSALLDMEPAVQLEEEEREKEPFLVRLLTRF